MKSVPVADRQGYAPINGRNIYYGIDGNGNPLIYIPPAFGSTGILTCLAPAGVLPG